MAGELSPFGRDVRDTIIKSSFTGVAATAIAIVAFSPSAFGDWIGASVASSFGFDSTADAVDNPYANLPAYPAPLTEAELSDIRGKLAATAASLELTRAADEARIEYFRSLALADGVVTFTPLPRAAVAPNESLRLTLSEPSPLAAPHAPVESYVMEAPAEATLQPASYSPGGYDATVPYRDPHLELADLLLAHETF